MLFTVTIMRFFIRKTLFDFIYILILALNFTDSFRKAAEEYLYHFSQHVDVFKYGEPEVGHALCIL